MSSPQPKTASLPLKRLGAVIIDILFIFLIWYWVTAKDLQQVDELLTTLDPAVEGSAEIFSQAVVTLVLKFLFKYVVVALAWRCLLPAVIGNGKTLGKLLLRLRMVDKNTLQEVSASRLVLREVLRVLFVLTVVPTLVSFVLFFCKKGFLHDIAARTTVIFDDKNRA